MAKKINLDELQQTAQALKNYIDSKIHIINVGETSSLEFDVKNNSLKIKLISMNDKVKINFGQGATETFDVQPNVISEIEHKYFGTLINHTVKILSSNDISYLDISGQSIQNLYCKNLLNLNKVLIYNNNISTCDFTGCENLQYLHMFDNPIVENSTNLLNTINSLPDRNNRAFGSILLFAFTGFNQQENIASLRRSIEQQLISKDWYVGSAIMYNETERVKVPKHIMTSGIIDIWESAEYGSGLNIGVYDRAINNISVEWDNSIFNYRKCGGDVDDTLKSWVNSSDIPSGATSIDLVDAKDTVHTTTTESHGYKTLSTIFAQGKGIYGIAPNARVNYVFYNNTSSRNTESNIDKDMIAIKKIMTDSDISYCCVNYTSTVEDMMKYYAQKIDNIIDQTNKPIFMASGNTGDGDLITDEVKYGQSYSEKTIVIGGLSSSNRSICWKASQNDSIDYCVGSYTLPLLNNQTTYKITNGTSFTAPIAAGIAGLLMNLYEKKNGSKPNREELLKILDTRCLPLFDYTSHEVGKGSINVMAYNNLYENEIKPTSINVTVPSTVTQFEKFKPTITVSPENASYLDYKIYCESSKYAIAKVGEYLYPMKSGTFTIRFILKNSGIYKDVDITVSENTNKKYILDRHTAFNLIGEFRSEDITSSSTEWKNRIVNNLDLIIDTSVMTFGTNKLSCPAQSIKTKGIKFTNLNVKDFTLNIRGSFDHFEEVLTSAKYLFEFKQDEEAYGIGLQVSKNNTPVVNYNFATIAFINLSNFDSMSGAKFNISGNIINNIDYTDVLYNGNNAVMTIKYKHDEKMLSLYMNGILIANTIYDNTDSAITDMDLLYRMNNCDVYDIQLFNSYLSNKQVIDSCLYLLSNSSLNDFYKIYFN